MGVRIEVWRTGEKKAVDVTPGWRSAMWSLLLDNGLTGRLDRNDIPDLIEVRNAQRKGVERAPFDWSQDIADSFDKITDILNKDGTCVVTGTH